MYSWSQPASTFSWRWKMSWRPEREKYASALLPLKVSWRALRRWRSPGRMSVAEAADEAGAGPPDGADPPEQADEAASAAAAIRRRIVVLGDGVGRVEARAPGRSAGQRKI